MKNILIIFLALVIVSCANDNKDQKGDANGNPKGDTAVMTDPTINMNNGGTTNPNTSTPPINPADVKQVNIPPDKKGIVYHYVCADGCVGGASNDMGTCSVCGKTLAHNQGFHQDPAGSNSVQVGANDLPKGLKDAAGNNIPSTPPPPSNDPPQNAKGVWHYTCPSGCAGGAGETKKCPKCGTQYTHNAIYHN